MSLDFTKYLAIPGKKLRSIKNEVTRIQTPQGSVIRKRYRVAQSYRQEIAQLQTLRSKGLHVPRVLFHQPSIVFLEDVGDTTYVDVLDLFHEEQAFMEPIHALLGFLFAYYDATHSLRGDINLRNFLYRDKLCYGIDFEDGQSDGPRENDLGRVLAFMLTYAPAFEKQRIAAAHVLWKGCLAKGLDPSLLWHHMQMEFRAMNERRQGFEQLYKRALAFAPYWEGLDA